MPRFADVVDMQRIYFTTFLLATLLSGCATIEYSDYKKKGEERPLFSRDVYFEVTNKFYQKPPDCVAFLPIKSRGHRLVNQYVEQSAARNFYGKVKTVIGPLKRSKIARHLALDLKRNQDRQIFSKKTACHHFIQPTLSSLDQSFVLFWSSKSLEIELVMHGVNEEEIFWRAAHSNKRSDGGFPTSPISVGTAIFKASQAHNDRETMPSMVDDALRRMMATLPDTRY